MSEKRILSARNTVIDIVKETEFTMHETEKCLSAAFENCNNVVLCGKPYSGKTFCALKYALDCDAIKTVIYSEYDREKYLTQNLSIDTILKKCLVKPFVIADTKLECGNYLVSFEDELTEDTLVIVDNFDINAPSPYMRHLFSLGCKVLIVTRSEMQNVGKNAVRVDVSDECEKNEPYDLLFLNDRQRELLMTLCAMLYYIDDGIKIYSSESGVFDENSVKYYLGDLANELDALIRHKLIKRTKRGELLVDRFVCRYVLDTLRPSAENCKTFMSFVRRITDFSILQDSKDISARLYTAENKFDDFASAEELLCVYTHFSKTDNRCGFVLYNLLVSIMLEKCAMQKGIFYKEHLLVRNMAYYLELVESFLHQRELAEVIYADKLYGNDFLPDIYTYSVKAKLDMIRLSVTYLRNTTVDLYAESKGILEILYRAMSGILDEVAVYNGMRFEKMLLLDDVLRLCDETFSYYEVIDCDGNYYSFRDDIVSQRIFYICQKQSDKLSACSLVMGYSLLTLKLYAMYRRYLDEWLELSENTQLGSTNLLLKELHDEKIRERKKTSQGIAVNFERMVNGFERYSDFFDEAFLDGRLYEFDWTFDKRLEDNKRLIIRGFDGGTKIGADRYSNMIIDSVKNCRNAIRCILPVLDIEYPLSDETYRCLRQKGFVNLISNHERIPNLTKQIIVEALIFKYNANFTKQQLVMLYEELIDSLLSCVSHNEAFGKRVKDAVCTAYVRAKLCEIEITKSLTDIKRDDFVSRLYEKVFADKNEGSGYCEQTVAECIGSAVYGRKQICHEKLSGAFVIYAAEQIMSGGKYSFEGLFVLAREIIGEVFAEELKTNIDNMLILTSEQIIKESKK